MRHTKIFKILFIVASAILCSGPIVLAGPVGTAFTYQGQLIDSNQPADGLYDFQFRMFDDSAAGTQAGPDVNANEVDVIDGYFTVELDFGNVLDGNRRWLDIGVRPGVMNDPNGYTTLSPRQEVTPAPYALYAKNAAADNDWMVSGNDMYSIPSGNVGIGTTTPSAPLTIMAGIGPDIEFVSAGSNADITAGAEFRVGTTNTSNFSILTNNLYRVNINGAGNVGIGKTSPSGRLDVSHDGSDSDLVVSSDNGNVGIGAAPSSSNKLQVTTNTDVVCARFDNWATNGFNYGVAGYAQGPGGTNHFGVYGYAYGGTNNWAGYFDGKLYASDAAVGTETPTGTFEVSHDGSSPDFVVDANTGNIGIGTAPSSSAHLSASTSSDVTCGEFTNWSTGGYSYGVRGLAQGSSGTNHIGVYGYANFATNNWAGYFQGNVYTSGNIGVGTTSPARKLHVSDVIRLEPRSTAPSSPSEGDIYMDSTTHKLMVYDGTAWQACW